MTRKHFIALARAVSDAQFINCPTAEAVAINTATRAHMAQSLASICASTNSNFDRARFLAACGVQL